MLIKRSILNSPKQFCFLSLHFFLRQQKKKESVLSVPRLADVSIHPSLHYSAGFPKNMMGLSPQINSVIMEYVGVFFIIHISLRESHSSSLYMKRLQSRMIIFHTVLCTQAAWKLKSIKVWPLHKQRHRKTWSTNKCENCLDILSRRFTYINKLFNLHLSFQMQNSRENRSGGFFVFFLKLQR